jgi:hypothetical protein
MAQSSTSADQLPVNVAMPNGLAEIAVNQGRADRDLGLTTGIPVEIDA